LGKGVHEIAVLFSVCISGAADFNVYSQSKGRTASVFVFNPFAEGHIARGRSFAPERHQTVLASDLANLPQFLCRSDDIVLLAKWTTDFRRRKTERHAGH
jgi:hypothetical protein